jgi:ornithine--oxo-acid transaminase
VQAKPTHQNIIRLAPPLVISEDEIKQALKIIQEAIIELPTLKGEAADHVIPNGEKGVRITLED